MVSERAATVAMANMLSSLIVKLQENGSLLPDQARALVKATFSKSAGETPQVRAEIREFLQAMFPGASVE